MTLIYFCISVLCISFLVTSVTLGMRVASVKGRVLYPFRQSIVDANLKDRKEKEQSLRDQIESAISQRGEDHCSIPILQENLHLLETKRKMTFREYFWKPFFTCVTCTPSVWTMGVIILISVFGLAKIEHIIFCWPFSAGLSCFTNTLVFNVIQLQEYIIDEKEASEGS